MKKILLAFPFLLFANLLNDIKQKEFDFDKSYLLQSAKENATSWINPIILQYTFLKDNIQKTTITKTFSISVNQPIFKSGAIFYSIKYAKHSKEYNLLDLTLKKRELIKRHLILHMIIK